MAATPKFMKALVKEQPDRGYVLREIETPKPGGDEVLIKIEKVAICGSDIALYLWNDIAKLIATVPFIPGHEATGTVVDVGPEATMSPGCRVAVENHFFCGKCYTCKDHRGDICINMNQYGHGRGTFHGGFSEYSIVSSKYCFPITSSITSDEAVLLEPLGATRVFITDINQERLELAKKMGADVVINNRDTNLKEEVMKLTDGNGVARLVEASGAPPMVNSCFSLLRKGAKLVLIGLPKEALHVQNVIKDVIMKSITLFTVHGRRIFHTWQQCEQLIADGKVNPNLIVSHKISMTDWQDAFDLLMSGKSCKIIVDPQT